MRILGPVELIVDDQQRRLRGPKIRALLAATALTARSPVSVRRLYQVLWGDDPPSSASANLRNYAAELRRVVDDVPGVSLSSRLPGYRLDVAPADVDLHHFEQLVAQGRAFAAADDQHSAAETLGRALELWRGPAFDGIPETSILRSEAGRLEELRLSAIEDQVCARLAIGDTDGLVAELRALTAQHPLRERLCEQLMLVQHRHGEPAEALQTFAAVRRRIRDKLGVEPGPRLRGLHNSILTGEPSAGPRETVVSLPVQRRRSSSVSAFQLPADTSDFSGREAALADCMAALERAAAAVPVVAIAGLPGIGKTTFAVRLARALQPSFPDGQLYVRLDGTSATPRDPAEVLVALLSGLGVDRPSIPPRVSDRAALLRGVLAGRRILIVLDDARDEAQIRDLLPGTSGCAIIVTSRSRLTGIPGAHHEELAELTGAEAYALLWRIVGAARLAAEPEATSAVLGICAGLPLAVRIVGAKLMMRRGWPVGTLADRLRDERGRLEELRAGDLAVRASLELSYAGLRADSAAVFGALGLLDSAEANEWMLAALLDEEHPEPAAEALVDAGLCRIAESGQRHGLRYAMHNLVHAYSRELAWSKYDHDRRQAAVKRLTDGWITLAAAATATLGADPAPAPELGWLPSWSPAARLVALVRAAPARWLSQERAGLVDAVRFAAENGQGIAATMLAATLDEACQMLGWIDEWSLIARAVLTAAERAGNPYEIALAQRSLARALGAAGQTRAALDLTARSQAVLGELGRLREVAYGRIYRSAWLLERGERAAALSEAKLALAVLIDLDDMAGVALARYQTGASLMHLERYDDARRHLTAARTVADELDLRGLRAKTVNVLGNTEFGDDRYARARDHFADSRREAYSIHYRAGEALAIHNMGRCEHRMENYEDAINLQGRALTLFAEGHNSRGQALVLLWLAQSCAAVGDHRLALTHLARSRMLLRRSHLPRIEAEILNAAAPVLAHLGRPSAAVTARRQARHYLREPAVR